jgi:hypothetical protein
MFANNCLHRLQKPQKQSFEQVGKYLAVKTLLSVLPVNKGDE